MLQELVVHSCAVAHHQKLRCRSLAKVPIVPLKVVKEDYDVFNGCHKIFGEPPTRPSGILRARQCDHEVQSALSGWGPGHAVLVLGT